MDQMDKTAQTKTEDRQRVVKQDRRSRRTRSRLSSALKTLLRTKPLKSITVTELTNIADVNRATFYAHYRDVFDMFDQIEASIISALREMVRRHSVEMARSNFRPLFNDVARYIEENSDDVSVALGPNSDGSILIKLIEVMRSSFLESVSSAFPETRRMFDENPTVCGYHFYFIAGGIAAIVKSWENEGRRESPELITQIIDSYASAITPDVLANNIILAGGRPAAAGA